MAIFDEHVMSEHLLTLAKQTVAQTMYDFLTGLVSSPKSITRAGNISYFQIPMIITDDVPRDSAEEAVSLAQGKLAWDIKTFIEAFISCNPMDTTPVSIMKGIPITVINKGYGYDESIDKRFSAAGISIVRPFEKDAKPSMEISFEESCVEINATEFASINKVKKTSNKLFSEGSKLKEMVFQDRKASPTRIEVNVKYKTAQNEIKENTLIFSVECTPRYVDISELMVRMSTYDNRKFYRDFVKLEAGEISFISGLMLNFKMLVERAKSRATGRGSELFNIIDRFSLLRDMGVNVCPFLMLLVSDTFIQKMSDGESMDVKREIQKILSSFFAMGMFIYNERTNTYEIFYDGDKQWKTYTRGAVESETSKYERQIKELIRFNK